MGIQDALRNHPAIGGLVGGVAVGAASVGIINIIRAKVRKPAKRKTSTTTRKKRKTSTTRRKTKSSAQKRRAKALRGAKPKKLFKTKNGRYYIKKASGQARFISNKAASSMKKRKGGFR